MTHKIDYRNRSLTNVLYNTVKPVLPEYFHSAYPNLVSFLEYYYDYMQDNGDTRTEAFSYIIQTLYQIRDAEESTLDDLDQLLYEIGFGINTNQFDASVDVRHVAKLISKFYRTKGREISMDALFQAFFGVDVEISYPKNDIFILNESKLGPEYLKYIRDDKRYQIYSILLKSSVPIIKWKQIVQKYVHPAGFYLAGDVVIEGIATNALGAMTPVTLDSDANTLSVSSLASLATPTTLSTVTAIWNDSPDSDAWAERIRLDLVISPFASTTVIGFHRQYDTLKEFLSAQSPTFDEDSTATNKTVDFSNTIETFDNSIFDYWDSDFNQFQYQDSN